MVNGTNYFRLPAPDGAVPVSVSHVLLLVVRIVVDVYSS